MLYNEFKFIYPPRAEVKTTPKLVSHYDTTEYIAQPKYNGSCVSVFLNDNHRVVNRHNEPKTRVDKSIDFKSVNKWDKWMVLSGELMDKSKKGEDGNVINGFIMWDILVYKGEYLIGSTTTERLEIMEKEWSCQRMMITPKGFVEYKHLCYTGIEGIYKSPSYMGGLGYFSKLYDELIVTDAYEGLVIKKANAKLELGFGEKNNSGWQLKARKPTKNYRI